MAGEYPVRNRPQHSGLGALDIELTTAYGKDLFDPNSIVGHLLTGKLNDIPPATDLVSDISGEPAVGYRTDEVSLALTVSELHRLLRRDLLPAEFFALAQKYGVFHEIHDFYDLNTGIALQPYD